MDDDGIKKLELIVYLIVLVAFVGSVFSLVAGALVEAFTETGLKPSH
jgi:hypothetical protein